jgi:hypothetical protein
MIKGLTPRLPEVGQVRIGEKVAIRDGKTRPSKLDHFRLFGAERDANNDRVRDTVAEKALIEQTAQDKLTRLPIMFPFDSIDATFTTFRAFYTKTCAWCRSDNGTTATRKLKEGGIKEVACPGDACEFSKPGGGCKPHGTLNFLIPGIQRGAGIYRFRTTSWNSINEILGGLAYIATLTNGALANIPLALIVKPVRTSYVDKDGQTKATTIYVCNVTTDGAMDTWQQQALEHVRNRAALATEFGQAQAVIRAAIAAPESPEDEKDLIDEFHPDAPEAPPVNGDSENAPAHQGADAPESQDDLFS